MRPLRWPTITLAATLALAAPAWSRAGERPDREETPATAQSPGHPIGGPIRGRTVRLPPPSAAGARADPAGEEVHRHDEPKPADGGPQAQESQEQISPGTEEELAATTAKALSPGTGFDGIDGVTSGTLPPDPTSAVSPPIGAAGIRYIVETVNEGLQVFDQNGGQATAYIPFWNPTTGFFSKAPARAVIFDPRVVFDPYAQRFFIVALENGAAAGFLHVAVSASADPRGAWTTFKTTTLGPSGQNFFPDYPSLGFDRQAIYIGLNLFLTVPPPGRPDGLLYRAIGKSTMLGSSPSISVMVDRFELNLPQQYPWAMRAAQTFDLPIGTAAEGLFIGPFRDLANPATQFQRLHMVKMRKPLDPAQASLALFDVPVPGYREPAVDAPQGATPCGTAPGPIDVSSGQLGNAVWRRDDLYAAQTVRRTVGTVVSNAARWYQIRTGPPTAPVAWSQLVQSGDVLADTTGAKHTYLPTVGVDANRSLVVAYAQSSAGEAVSFRVAARAACAGEGVLQSFLSVKSADFCYEQGGPPHRWGDYWSLAVEPGSATRLWATGEYVKAKNTWGTWIEPLELIPDCPPCSCSL